MQSCQPACTPAPPRRHRPRSARSSSTDRGAGTAGACRRGAPTGSRSTTAPAGGRSSTTTTGHAGRARPPTSQIGVRLLGPTTPRPPASSRRSGDGDVERGVPFGALQAVNAHDGTFNIYGNGAAACPGSPDGWALLGRTSPARSRSRRRSTRRRPPPATCSGCASPDGTRDPLPRRRSASSSTAPAPTADRQRHPRRELPQGRAVTRGARRAGATPAAAPGCTRCWAIAVAPRSFALIAEPLPGLRGQHV